jgi:hypothetical protein
MMRLAIKLYTEYERLETVKNSREAQTENFSFFSEFNYSILVTKIGKIIIATLAFNTARNYKIKS